MKPYAGDQYRRGDLSVTEKVIDEIVTLPMYPQMKKDEIEYLIESIEKVIQRLK
jgi:dTDP-4-amino-4,6-dideoxygalactose transaminase